MAPRANSTYNSTHDPPGIQPAYAAVARAMSAWDSKPYVCVPFETLTQLVRLPETTYVCNPKSKAVRGIHVCSRRYIEKARKGERRGPPKKKPARKERRGPPKQKPQKARKERRGPPKQKPQKARKERRGTPKKKPARKKRRGPPKKKPQKAQKERRGPPNRPEGEAPEGPKGTASVTVKLHEGANTLFLQSSP